MTAAEEWGKAPILVLAALATSPMSDTQRRVALRILSDQLRPVRGEGGVSPQGWSEWGYRELGHTLGVDGSNVRRALHGREDKGRTPWPGLVSEGVAVVVREHDGRGSTRYALVLDPDAWGRLAPADGGPQHLQSTVVPSTYSGPQHLQGEVPSTYSEGSPAPTVAPKSPATARANGASRRRSKEAENAGLFGDAAEGEGHPSAALQPLPSAASRNGKATAAEKRAAREAHAAELFAEAWKADGFWRRTTDSRAGVLKALLGALARRPDVEPEDAIEAGRRYRDEVLERPEKDQQYGKGATAFYGPRDEVWQAYLPEEDGDEEEREAPRRPPNAFELAELDPDYNPYA